MFKFLFAFLLLTSPLLAQESVRAEIAYPLQEAQKLLKANRPKEALIRLQEVDAIGERRPYENMVLEQTRFAAAIAANNPELGAKSLEKLQSIGGLSPQLRLQFAQTLATSFFNAKEYNHAINWASAYINQGGNDLNTKLILTYSQYFANDLEGARKSLANLVLDAEKKAQPIPENYIQLGLNIALQQKDEGLYLNWQKKKLRYYPSAEDWGAVIDKTVPNADSNTEALRLKYETASFGNPLYYSILAELYLQQGFPGLALEIIEQGLKIKALGNERDLRLKEFINKNANEDKKNLAQESKKDFNHGLALYSYGEKEAGFKLMEELLAVNDNPEQHLRLGIYYLLSGHKENAIGHLKHIKNNPLAELWLLKAGE